LLGKATEQLGFHHCPRAITTTVSLPLARMGFGCPSRKLSGRFQTSAVN